MIAASMHCRIAVDEVVIIYNFVSVPNEPDAVGTRTGTVYYAIAG